MSRALDLKVGDTVACIDTGEILGRVTSVRMVNEEDTRDLRVTVNGEEHWDHDLCKTGGE